MAAQIWIGSRLWSSGDQPALLSFVRLQNVGWFLEAVEAANQDAVSENTRRDIIRAFSGAADLCPFQPDKFYGKQLPVGESRVLRAAVAVMHAARGIGALLGDRPCCRAPFK